MPELPEVETVRRGIEPLVRNQTIASVVCRVPRLRRELCADLGEKLSGRTVRNVARRAKYLLLHLDRGTLVIHLGMTGILRVLQTGLAPATRHDHFDLVFASGRCLRLNDSRRFGAVLYEEGSVDSHPLFRGLGPEPLSDLFSPEFLWRLSRSRRVAVKNFLMNQKVVVGVGNIYASEALFRSGIDPRRPAGKISLQRYEILVSEVKSVLQEAIDMGGTTIRDFSGSDGKPGYFRQKLLVYGREGDACFTCGKRIRNVRLGGRSTFFCPHCQN